VCVYVCYLDDGASEKELSQWKVDADNGDKQAQLLLGQHYLNLAQLGTDSQTNAKLAVSFLIKSSKQGSDEATTLLTDCCNKELGWYILLAFAYVQKNNVCNI